MLTFSKRNFCLLKNKLAKVLPAKIEEFQSVRKNYGDKVVENVTVSQVLGGMRGIHALHYETSKLDNSEGIKYRSKNLYELIVTLKNHNTHEPSPEGLLWYLLTGEEPSQKEIDYVEESLRRRYGIPDWIEEIIRKLPKDIHPMTQFILGINLLQSKSLFAKKYSEGMKKNEYWEYTYEDSLNLIANLPRLTALIYNNQVHGRDTPQPKSNYNQGQNLAYMLGRDNKECGNLFNHYIFLHADHEGGNVSAHTGTLVGSALADPYLSYGAAMAGLAGPLHGLANQETLKWLLGLQAEVGDNPSDEQVATYAKDWLGSGKVIPGYGHAVLRKPDPRYLIQIDFAEKNFPEDKLIKLVNQCFRIIPPILEATGKVKNPWPNVDCCSGAVLSHYGFNEYDFYTVYFGISRAYGVLPNLVLSRAMGCPIERPNSVSLEWIKKNVI